MRLVSNEIGFKKNRLYYATRENQRERERTVERKGTQQGVVYIKVR